MFGIDHFVLSKPIEVKTVATKFVENIKKVVESKTEEKVISFVTTERPRIPKLETPKLQKLDTSILKKKDVDNLKPETLKTVAKTFLGQVNKIPGPPRPQDKLIFSYSDSKGKLGNLDPNGEKLRVILRKNKLKDYNEDIIEVYSKGVNVLQDGIFIQTKGWGNTKELAIANAIKNAVLKFAVVKSDINEKVLFNYSLSRIQPTGDGGFECKVKVTPGKI